MRTVEANTGRYVGDRTLGIFDEGHAEALESTGFVAIGRFCSVIG
jgi:hypothetical protein